MRKLSIALLTLSAALALSACERDSELENAVEEAGDTVQDAAEEAGDKVEEATDDIDG